MLSNIEGERTSVLTWLPASFSYAQVGATSSITVAIERRGTAHLSRLPPFCSPELQIDAVVHLSTSDGAFDEILQTSFAITDERSAWTSVVLDPEAVTGNFEAPASLWLDIYASPLGTGGALSDFFAEPLAVWTQSEACAGAELVGPAAADQLNASMAVLPWQGSSPLRYTNEASSPASTTRSRSSTVARGRLVRGGLRASILES